MGSFNMETSGTSVFYIHQLNQTFLNANLRTQESLPSLQKPVISVNLPLNTADDEIFRNVRGDEKVTRIRNAILENKLLSFTSYSHEKENSPVMFSVLKTLTFNYNNLLYYIAFLYCTSNVLVLLNQLLAPSVENVSKSFDC